MPADPLDPSLTLVCFSATADEVVAIAEHTVFHRLTVPEWVGMIVRKALETERVERSEGAQMAATNAVEAVARRRG